MSEPKNVVERLDAVVNDFSSRVRFFSEPMTVGRAKMFVLQHRQNTRYRNSVLKLRVATNTPDWDTRLRILGACAEEIIADNEFGGGRPHWAILQALGRRIGLTDIEMEGATPLVTTRIAWLAWEALMSNRHWIEGLIANTCAERANVPGYGTGIIRAHGWFGLERHRWKQVFGLSDEELEFFGLHEEADIVHSNLGWQKAADQAVLLHMEDQLVTACRTNLLVWESYLNGIADGGDALDRGEVPMAA